MSQLQKWVPVRKMCHSQKNEQSQKNVSQIENTSVRKIGHNYKNKHNWKNVSQLEQLVTDRKVGDSQKNEHSWKMCHSKKNESQLEIYTP